MHDTVKSKGLIPQYLLSDMMRIAMLAPIAWRTPPRHYGPWERVVSLLTEGLIRKNMDVTLFATSDPDAIPGPPELVRVRQGFLELSNVDPVRMMTEMIEVLRGYESYQKAIRALDEASAKSINEVGRVA